MDNATCSIEGCTRKRLARGWCSTHYRRWHTIGSVELAPKPKVQRVCTIEDCEKPLFGKGMCNMHYSRARRHGNPSTVLQVRHYGAACSADGCAAPIDSLGLCGKHYQRMRAFGQLDLPDRRSRCSVEGCERNGGDSRMCSMHRRRLARHGDVNALRRNSSPPETCTREGCARPYLASGFCSAHLDAHYRATNPGRFAAKDARRRMGEQAGMARADRAESAWYRNLNLNSPCSYCGAPADTNDHLRAVVNGGTDHWWNLAACCKSCNSSKGAKELLEFLIYRLEGGIDEGALPA